MGGGCVSPGGGWPPCVSPAELPPSIGGTWARAGPAATAHAAAATRAVAARRNRQCETSVRSTPTSTLPFNKTRNAPLIFHGSRPLFNRGRGRAILGGSRHDVRGGVPERSNGAVLKTVGPATGPWVRIPPPPLEPPDRSSTEGSGCIRGNPADASHSNPAPLSTESEPRAWRVIPKSARGGRGLGLPSLRSREEAMGWLI